jgi:hypothetical protein
LIAAGLTDNLAAVIPGPVQDWPGHDAQSNCA